MTAENRGSPASWSAPTNCFNEAAADDRGKRRQRGRMVDRAVASMRPRPMTAENGVRAAGSAVRAGASMRPRPMTAENAGAAANELNRGMALQ